MKKSEIVLLGVKKCENNNLNNDQNGVWSPAYDERREDGS